MPDDPTILWTPASKADKLSMATTEFDNLTNLT